MPRCSDSTVSSIMILCRYQFHLQAERCLKVLSLSARRSFPLVCEDKEKQKKNFPSCIECHIDRLRAILCIKAKPPARQFQPLCSFFQGLGFVIAELLSVEQHQWTSILTLLTTTSTRMGVQGSQSKSPLYSVADLPIV